MTHHHHEEPGHQPDEADEPRGPDDTARPTGQEAGPGRDPGREAPSGRPGKEASGGSGRSRPASGGAGGSGGGPGGGSGADPGGGGGSGPGSGGTGGSESGTGRGGAAGERSRRAWGDAFSEVQGLVGDVVGDVLEGVRDAASGRFPRMDLIRVEGEGYRLLVDLPGLSRSDVEVLTLGNELTVKGERRRPELPEGSEILRSERAHGRFERTIRMPPEVREEGVAATFEDGVLTVRLPRVEPSEARPVDIG